MTNDQRPTTINAQVASTAGNLRSSTAMGTSEKKVLGWRNDRDGHDLIALAQKLARDAERHALLSASLASQAERLMVAGLRRLDRPAAATGH